MRVKGKHAVLFDFYNLKSELNNTKNMEESLTYNLQLFSIQNLIENYFKLK